jgi:hypothetical protein
MRGSSTPPARSTPKQVTKLAAILVEMEGAGLDRSFIVAASGLARTDQGVYDLIALWSGTRDDSERDARGPRPSYGAVLWAVGSSYAFASRRSNSMPMSRTSHVPKRL